MNRKYYRNRPNDRRKKCTDPRWISLPIGGQAGSSNYNYSKTNYCDRCSQGTGGFPVSWLQSGQWNYNPTSGTDYCPCCDNFNPRSHGRKQISQQSNTPLNPKGLRNTYRNIKNINRNIYNI